MDVNKKVVNDKMEKIVSMVNKEEDNLINEDNDINNYIEEI